MITFFEGDNKAGITKHGVNITRSNETLEYEIAELQKFTWYIITVKAFTAIGGGNETVIRIRTSEDSKCDMCFIAFIIILSCTRKELKYTSRPENEVLLTFYHTYTFCKCRWESLYFILTQMCETRINI